MMYCLQVIYTCHLFYVLEVNVWKIDFGDLIVTKGMYSLMSVFFVFPRFTIAVDLLLLF